MEVDSDHEGRFEVGKYDSHIYTSSIRQSADEAGTVSPFEPGVCKIVIRFALQFSTGPLIVASRVVHVRDHVCYVRHASR